MFKPNYICSDHKHYILFMKGIIITLFLLALATATMNPIHQLLQEKARLTKTGLTG